MPIRYSSVAGGSGGGIPSGETADRPENPSIGDQFYNGTLGILEIYTSSGWLPATGANDFNISLSGPATTVTLSKEYLSGAYTLTSSLGDSSYDIYLYNTNSNLAGYTTTPSVLATSAFNKIVVLGGTAGDLISFEYKTTFAATTIDRDTSVGPVAVSITASDLPDLDDTTSITGINFAEDVEVVFRGTDLVDLVPKNLVRSSSTSLIVTRPDNISPDNAPYSLIITNPGVSSPTGSNANILSDILTVGGRPAWSTPSQIEPFDGTSVDLSLVATDPDGDPITYSVASGSSLPPGISLNSTTGNIYGTLPAGGAYSFVISATDLANNVTNRTFNLLSLAPVTLSWETYGSGVTVTDTGSGTYSVYNTSGSNTGWTKGAITTTYFNAPFTVGMRKYVSSTATDSYTMGGIIPTSNITTAKSANESYNYGYMHYPVTPSSYNWYESGNNGNFGSFTGGDTVYITVDENGTLEYWKNNSLLRTTTTLATEFAVQIANYAQNNTYGGFFDIFVIPGAIWNGTSFGA